MNCLKRSLREPFIRILGLRRNQEPHIAGLFAPWSHRNQAGGDAQRWRPLFISSKEGSGSTVLLLRKASPRPAGPSHSLCREFSPVRNYLNIGNCSLLLTQLLPAVIFWDHSSNKRGMRTGCFFYFHSCLLLIWKLSYCHWASWSQRRKECKAKIWEISSASSFLGSSHRSWRLPSWSPSAPRAVPQGQGTVPWL